MPKIGDRYIIEIDDILSNTNKTECLYCIKGFNSLVFDQKGIDKLLKYNDCIKIDLAKAEKQGYEKGLAESKEEDEIKVGDEVIWESGKGIVISMETVVYSILMSNGSVWIVNRITNKLSKTGRSFPVKHWLEEMNAES